MKQTSEQTTPPAKHNTRELENCHANNQNHLVDVAVHFGRGHALQTAEEAKVLLHGQRFEQHVCEGEHGPVSVKEGGRKNTTQATATNVNTSHPFVLFINKCKYTYTLTPHHTVLRADAEDLLRAMDGLGDVIAADNGRAGRGREHARQHAHRGRLAGADDGEGMKRVM